MFNEFFEEQTLLFVALTVVVIMLIYSYVGDKIAGFKSVNAQEATRLYNDGAFVLDVRSPAEYKEGYIGEAVNITPGDLASQASKLPKDKSTEILVYCLSGARSSRAASSLGKMGYISVNNLSGGINAWKAASMPVNKSVSKKARKKKA
jgi:phage shock protein E